MIDNVDDNDGAADDESQSFSIICCRRFVFSVYFLFPVGISCLHSKVCALVNRSRVTRTRSLASTIKCRVRTDKLGSVENEIRSLVVDFEANNAHDDDIYVGRCASTRITNTTPSTFIEPIKSMSSTDTLSKK